MSPNTLPDVSTTGMPRIWCVDNTLLNKQTSIIDENKPKLFYLTDGPKV